MRYRLGSSAMFGNAILYGRPQRTQNGSAAMTGSAAMSADVNSRIYAASREFITNPTDIPSSQPFLGTLQKVIRFDRSIISGGQIGKVTTGWGDMELINSEGDYDDLIDRYAVDGRRIIIKVGVVDALYEQFITIFDGTASDWNVEESILRIQIRDNTYRLEVPAQPLLYGGSGGLDGTDDLKGKRKPLALGECLNVTPVILIPNALIYQVSSGPVHGIGPVYDRAVMLASAGDFPTPEALISASTGAAGSGASIEAGEYGTCLSAGLFKLGGSPVGTVTCDVRGDKTGGTYADTTASVVRRLIGMATDILDPSGLIGVTFNSVNAAQPAVIGYWLDGSQDTNVADVIADLMGSIGGWGGMRRNGRFELGIFTSPSGQPTAIYDRVEIVEIERQKLPDGLSPLPWRFRLAWGRNHTIQTDVEGGAGITAERVAFLREGRRLATSDALKGKRLLADHPLAQDPQPVESYFRDEEAAQSEASRLLNLYGTTNALYRIRLKILPFSHEIGEVILVTFPRWDLKDGRLLRIVSITDDTDANTIEVIGFG